MTKEYGIRPALGTCCPEMKYHSLFQYTLKKLKSHYATRNIPYRLESSKEYDEMLGKRICNYMYSICETNINKYNIAINDFIGFSLEFLQLQMKLRKTGKYPLNNYEEARKAVYDNPEYMRKYLNGLVFSQAFWINHHKIFNLFIQEFCFNNPKNGIVVEVPVGTGIFISEFLSHNQDWKAEGYDISETAIEYSKVMLDVRGMKLSRLKRKDIFSIEHQTYDLIICGELLEHLENPEDLLKLLKSMLRRKGKIFLTTAIWAANFDHIYLFKSTSEVRRMLRKHFCIETELAIGVFKNKITENDKNVPVNYACILRNPKDIFDNHKCKTCGAEAGRCVDVMIE